jgi:hypothetical protein
MDYGVGDLQVLEEFNGCCVYSTFVVIKWVIVLSTLVRMGVGGEWCSYQVLGWWLQEIYRYSK